MPNFNESPIETPLEELSSDSRMEESPQKESVAFDSEKAINAFASVRLEYMKAKEESRFFAQEVFTANTAANANPGDAVAETLFNEALQREKIHQDYVDALGTQQMDLVNNLLATEGGGATLEKGNDAFDKELLNFMRETPQEAKRLFAKTPEEEEAWETIIAGKYELDRLHRELKEGAASNLNELQNREADRESMEHLLNIEIQRVRIEKEQELLAEFKKIPEDTRNIIRERGTYPDGSLFESSVLHTALTSEQAQHVARWFWSGETEDDIFEQLLDTITPEIEGEARRRLDEKL